MTAAQQKPPAASEIEGARLASETAIGHVESAQAAFENLMYRIGEEFGDNVGPDLVAKCREEMCAAWNHIDIIPTHLAKAGAP